MRQPRVAVSWLVALLALALLISVVAASKTAGDAAAEAVTDTGAKVASRRSSSVRLAIPPTPLWQKVCDEYAAVWDMFNVSISGKHELNIELFGLSKRDQLALQRGIQDRSLVAYKHYMCFQYDNLAPLSTRIVAGTEDESEEYPCDEWIEGTSFMVSPWQEFNYWHTWNDVLLPMFVNLDHAGVATTADAANGNTIWVYCKSLWEKAIPPFRELLSRLGKVRFVDEIFYGATHRVCFRHLRYGRGPLPSYLINREFDRTFEVLRAFLRQSYGIPAAPPEPEFVELCQARMPLDAKASEAPTGAHEASAARALLASRASKSRSEQQEQEQQQQQEQEPGFQRPSDDNTSADPAAVREANSELVRCRVVRIVYVKRESRRVANDDMVIAMLRDQGYSVSVFDPMASTASNLALFARADVVMGIHGAGLTNAIYARNDTIVVEFRPWFFCESKFFPGVFYRAGNAHLSVFLPQNTPGFVTTGTDSIAVPKALVIDLINVLDHKLRVRDAKASQLRHADTVDWPHQMPASFASEAEAAGPWRGSEVRLMHPSLFWIHDFPVLRENTMDCHNANVAEFADQTQALTSENPGACADWYTRASRYGAEDAEFDLD